jgi:protein-disulfide isomerase
MSEPVEAEEAEEPSKSGSRAWLVTLLVGLVMLVAGALLGYVGRGQFGPEAQAAKATSQAQDALDATQAVLAATQAAANADLMKYLTENTRHYKGDPNAAVTIIEFSDYQ